MIDLNNTWCEATKENYDKLVECGYLENKYSMYNMFLHITEGIRTIQYTQKNVLDSYRKTHRQIHLVDGEFEYVNTKSKNLQSKKEWVTMDNQVLTKDDFEVTKYAKVERVEEKPKNNFEEYGFQEPKFDDIIEIKILKKVSLEKCDELNYSRRKQYVYVGYVLCHDGLIPLEWDKNGECINDDEFDLTPLKPKWYEDESSIGKLISFDVFYSQEFGILKRYTEDNWIDITTLKGDFVQQKAHKCRPATKEEVLSLLVEE